LARDAQFHGDENVSIHQYAGTWVTPDGGICKVLFSDGRFIETRSGRPQQLGRYNAGNERIDFWGDFGAYGASVISHDEIRGQDVTLYRLQSQSPEVGDG
jgi:hypothetical protein